MNIKRIIVTGLLVLLVVALTGCGTKANVSKSNQTTNSPAAQSSNKQSSSQQPAPSGSSIAQQQAQVQSINTKSAEGQAQVDQKIDQHLQSLDNALDSLDKSSGSL